MMVHNNFGRDAFRVLPCQGGVRVIRKVRQSLQQVTGTLGRAGETPEVGRSLKRDANEIVL